MFYREAWLECVKTVYVHVFMYICVCLSYHEYRTHPKRITAPIAVTIFLSLSEPGSKGNTHTVVFTPLTSKTGFKVKNKKRKKTQVSLPESVISKIKDDLGCTLN